VTSILGKAKETVISAGQSIADAMKVAVISCALSVLAIVIGIIALSRTRNA
jgi:hypothetical protein